MFNEAFCCRGKAGGGGVGSPIRGLPLCAFHNHSENRKPISRVYHNPRIKSQVPNMYHKIQNHKRIQSTEYQTLKSRVYFHKDGSTIIFLPPLCTRERSSSVCREISSRSDATSQCLRLVLLVPCTQCVCVIHSPDLGSVGVPV